MTRATKTLYTFFAIATIVAMTISLAYSAVVPSQPSTQHFVSYDNRGLGLRLELSVNSTHLRSGDGILITITESNIRFFSNELRAGSDWRVRGLGKPCGYNAILGFGIFQGNYVENNVSLGSPLQLYKPQRIYDCGMIFEGTIYIFEPGSNLVEVVLRDYPTYSFKTIDQDQGEVNGSWSDSMVFHQFSPGEYTVAGEDGWGDLVFLGFSIS